MNFLLRQQCAPGTFRSRPGERAVLPGTSQTQSLLPQRVCPRRVHSSPRCEGTHRLSAHPSLGLRVPLCKIRLRERARAHAEG